MTEKEEADCTKDDVYQAHLKDYHNFCRAITWTTVSIVVFLGVLAYLFL